MQPTVVVHDIAALLTMDATQGEGPLGVIHDAAVALEGDRVVWMGPSSGAPTAPNRVDGRHCLMLPGLVDSHTHSVWAGSRAEEFQERLSGVHYSEILERGGGILSTVRNTRAADEAALAMTAMARLVRMRKFGVTTVEVKSGYGLSPAHEVKLLRAAKIAGEGAGVRVMRTFLGAHAVPLEHRGDRAGYVREVIELQLPLAAPEADFIDVYVDRGAFTVDEGRSILSAGKAAGLGVRIHAEQVAFTGAAKMAAEIGALSADHLERLDPAGVAAMAKHGTIAGLLPGAMLYLKDPPPPVALLREAGVPMAVATDFNPGSSPVDNLWACATLACVTMGLTVSEALLGITAVGADALGRPDLGRIRVGGPADLVLVRPPAGEPAKPASLIQYLGAPRVEAVWCSGVRGRDYSA